MSGSPRLESRARRALGAVCVALALAVAGLAAPSHGPIGAQPAQARGVTSGNASVPDLAVNDRGDAIAAWYRTVDDLYRIEARFRPAGGSWGEIKVLMSGAPGTNLPHVAIDAAGNSSVIWVRQVDGTYRIQTARRAAGGAWGATKTLSPAGIGATYSDIAMDDDGNITAAWELFPTGGIQVSRKPVGGSWTQPDTISPQGEGAHFPVIGSNPGGAGMLAWVSSPTSRIKAVRRPPGGPWSGVMNVSQADNPADGQTVGLDAQGRAMVAWRGPAEGTTAIFTRRRTSQGWGPVEQVSPSGKQASSAPRLALSPGGDAYVAWVGVDTGVNAALVARRPAGGSWSNALRLSPVRRTGDGATVATNARGDALAVYPLFDEQGRWLEESYRPSGQSWGLSTDLTDLDGDAAGAEVAMADDGTAHLLFVALAGSIYRVHAMRRTPGGNWSHPVALSGLP